MIAGSADDRHGAASSTGTSVMVLTSIWGWLKVRIVNAPVTVTGLPSERLRLLARHALRLEVRDDPLVDLRPDLAVLGLVLEVAELR